MNVIPPQGTPWEYNYQDYITAWFEVFFYQNSSKKHMVYPIRLIQVIYLSILVCLLANGTLALNLSISLTLLKGNVEFSITILLPPKYMKIISFSQKRLFFLYFCIPWILSCQYIIIVQDCIPILIRIVFQFFLIKYLLNSGIG